MSAYFSITDEEEKYMLNSIRLNSIEELFTCIPNNIKLRQPLDLPLGIGEYELTEKLRELSIKNKNLKQLTCFLGAGAYDHVIPSVVNYVTGKTEFYTAYTPYQPEISQGTLQTIFEYQSLMCNLTDMDVSNASLYDGATAIAEAIVLSVSETKRREIIICNNINPNYKKVINTYCKFKNIKITEIEEYDGEMDIDKLNNVINSNVAAVVIQNPNFFGIIEDVSEIEKIVHKNGSLLIMSVNPIALAVLKTPGEIGADIAVGEAQVLGSELNFGGPYLGFFTVTKKLLRKVPGRIVGETVDVDGKRGFVLTLQSREQHIRREKASSNICSNQALNALAAAVFLCSLGKDGLKKLANLNIQKAHYAYNKICSLNLYKPIFNKPFFNEFCIKVPINCDVINKELNTKKILGGLNIDNYFGKHKNSMLVAVTEKRTKKEIDRFIKSLEEII